MEIISFILIFIFLINYTNEILLCPKSNKPSQKINIDTSYTINTINPVIYKNENYTAVQVGNKIFLNRFIWHIQHGTSEFYENSEFCPKYFKIPTKEDSNH